MERGEAAMIPLETPLLEVETISVAQNKMLARLGLGTVGDLLTHYPKRHEDRTRFDHFPAGETEGPVCVCGVVAKTSMRRFGGYKKMFDATLAEPSESAFSTPLVCRWFNLHYVQKVIAVGQKLIVYGRPRLRGKLLCIEHPEFEVIEDDAELSLNLNRITPVYPATEGLGQRLLRKLIFDLLQHLREIETPLPQGLSGMQRGAALRAIHFPENNEQLEAARQHLVLTEFFAMQLAIASRRAKTVSALGASHRSAEGFLTREFLQALPFALTGAQVRTMQEVRADLASSRPMHRLLQGDVGSGKTMVALLAMLDCVEAGFQAALMAPTQILAEQHYLNFCRLLEPLGLRIGLRTGSRREETLPLFAAQPQTPGSTGRWPVAVGGPPTARGDVHYHKRSLPRFERPWAKYAITLSSRERRTFSAEARDIILDCILHWQDRRYELYAACVMSDHVHLLIEPFVKDRDEDGNLVFYSLSEILHTIKSFTAHEINKLANTKGAVWESESFDRVIRSEKDLREKFLYIVGNPWESKLVSPDAPYKWIWFPGVAGADFSAGRQKEQASGLCSPDAGASDPHILIGTHALLYDSTEFADLGLVVIDEQHKFGVLQRARLTTRVPAPDVLVMTATPIPRTLTLTAYGDLDVSILDELPPGRGKIKTELREDGKLKDPQKFKEYLAAGRQAYVVCSIIDEAEGKETKAATIEYARWSEFLAPLKCELLHGRIPPEEKEAIMRRFRANEIQVLVATTVIEVGIDVPNATVMIIENAEKFGLAQLHQLRGRIGRGSETSFCILLAGTKDPASLEKLRVLSGTTDGFAIAEADLELRGPGDILGTAQSGLPPLKIGNILRDGDLMRQARKAATELIADDPDLAKPENRRFRELFATSAENLLSHVS